MVAAALVGLAAGARTHRIVFSDNDSSDRRFKYVAQPKLRAAVCHSEFSVSPVFD